MLRADVGVPVRKGPSSRLGPASAPASTLASATLASTPASTTRASASTFATATGAGSSRRHAPPAIASAITQPLRRRDTLDERLDPRPDQLGLLDRRDMRP